MFNDAAVHRTSLMNPAIRYDSPAHISVQQKNHSTVKLRMVPQLQAGGGFRVMFKMTGIGKMFRKVFQIHTGVIHNHPIGYGSMIRRGNSLGCDRNPKYFFLFIAIFRDKFFNFSGNLLVIG